MGHNCGCKKHHDHYNREEYFEHRQQNKRHCSGKCWIVGGLVLAGAVAGAVVAMKKKKTIPDGVFAVEPFDSERYLGKWYEIARFDFRHEKNMSNVTAEYSLNEDGSVKVVNRGFDEKKGKWETSEGKAKFVESPYIGMLKVSFFGPFYAGYNVIAIDPEYKYALVVGDSRDYMWILSREKTIPEEIKLAYLEEAASLGFQTCDLVWTEQK